jgi:4-amino-4-deoxy-L-arabinose transferase-like glycosyltransferase
MEPDPDTTRQALTRRVEIALLLGVVLLLFCSRLGAFGLLGADEPRYAQVGREMLERNDWVTPVLYGQPWLEKPIALYWGEMVSYKLFGVSDSAARLPAAFAASMMVAFIFFWLKTLSFRSASGWRAHGRQRRAGHRNGSRGHHGHGFVCAALRRNARVVWMV